mmetsp:Transcript_89106/g.235695  ORF Transcript_89106/g.235695 Transcript_89106/m.235695 type:complete len:94 (+) Transcript_89106:139-420(+)
MCWGAGVGGMVAVVGAAVGAIIGAAVGEAVGDAVAAAVGAVVGETVGETAGVGMHNFHPPFCTLKSDDHTMLPVGVTPSGPEIPENVSPSTTR